MWKVKQVAIKALMPWRKGIEMKVEGVQLYAYWVYGYVSMFSPKNYSKNSFYLLEDKQKFEFGSIWYTWII